MLVGNSHLGMMAAGGGGGIVIESTALTEPTTALTDHPITMPAGIAVGDLILVVFAVDTDPTVSIDTGVSGSNWTIEGSLATSNKVTGTVVWKIAEGSDALELDTSGSEHGAAVAYRISGADEVDVTSVTGGSDSSPNPPSHTPVGGSQDYLWIAGAMSSRSSTITVAPTNYSNFLATGLVTGSPGLGTAERALTASSEDPGVFTSSVSKDWVTFTIAVHPG